MTEEKQFDGFSEPTENWFKVPNEFISLLPTIETVGELKVVLYIMRHTWGYHDENKKITLEEFVNGRKRKDQSRIDNGCGVSEPTVINGLKMAQLHGFVKVETDNSDLGRIKKLYSIVSQGDLKKLYLTGKDLDENDSPKDSLGLDSNLFRAGPPKTLPPSEKETLIEKPRKKLLSGANAPEQTPIPTSPLKEEPTVSPPGSAAPPPREVDGVSVVSESFDDTSVGGVTGSSVYTDELTESTASGDGNGNGSPSGNGDGDGNGNGRKRALSEKERARAELEAHFSKLFNIPVPYDAGRATRRQRSAMSVRWWQPLDLMWETYAGRDMALAKKIMGMVKVDVDTRGVGHVSAPQSIVSEFVNVARRVRPRDGNGDGKIESEYVIVSGLITTPGGVGH